MMFELYCKIFGFLILFNFCSNIANSNELNDIFLVRPEFTDTWSRSPISNFGRSGELDVTSAKPDWNNVWTSDVDQNSKNDLSSTPIHRKASSLVNWESHNLLIVYGGLDQDGNVLNDLWTFNYSSTKDLTDTSNNWNEVAPTSFRAQPLAGHLGLLRNKTNDMVIFGGMTSQADAAAPYTTAGSNRIWIFHLENLTWSVTGYNADAPLQRTEAVGGIYNDELYIFGGMDVESLNDFSDLWKYNFEKQTWTLLDNGQSSGPPARFSHAGCIFGSSLYTVGGRALQGTSYEMLDDVWVYDFENGFWEQILVEPLYSRAYHSVVSYGNQFYVFGGYTKVEENAQTFLSFAFNTLLVQNIQNKYWQQYFAPTSPQVRFDHNAVVTSDGIMFVYGGRYQSVDDVVELVLLDLSKIEPAMVVNAPPDQIGITSGTIAGIYSAHFVIAILALVSGCSCIVLVAVRRRFSNRNIVIQQEDFFLFTIQSERARNLQRGLDENIVRSMPLVSYCRGAAPEAFLTEEDGETDICSICLLDFEEGKSLRQLPCRHLFHPACVEAWLLGHANCPLCKREFDSSGNFVDQSGETTSFLHRNNEFNSSGNFVEQQLADVSLHRNTSNPSPLPTSSLQSNEPHSNHVQRVTQNTFLAPGGVLHDYGSYSTG